MYTLWGFAKRLVSSQRVFGSDVHDLGRSVAAGSVLEDGNHDFPQGVGAGGEFGFLPRFCGVE